MKARHVAVVAKKDFFGLASEKTILLAVLLQVFIALFSSFLMVGLTSMYDPAALSGYSHFRSDLAHYAGNDTPLLGYLEGFRPRVHRIRPSRPRWNFKGAQALRRPLRPGHCSGYR